MSVQVAFFCLSALAHGTAFVRWKRWSEGEKQKGWALYGWFTGLSFCGSIAGALAYACRLLLLKNLFIYSDLETIVNPTPAQMQQSQTLRAASRRWAAAHYALFPFELGIVVLAKLLVLHRMQLCAVRTSRPERWRNARQGLLGVVVLLNALGICANFGAAFYFNQTADFNLDSASAYGANRTATGKEMRGKAEQKVSVAGRVSSIQRFSEVCVLMLIIVAFSTVGVFSARVIASALSTLFNAQQRLVAMAGHGVGVERVAQGRQLIAEASLQGRQLQRKVIGTFVFVFVTVLLRSAFSVTYAVAQALQNISDPCAIGYCDPCKNVYANIQGWILHTPEVQQVAMIIASPMALLVALWGMSGVQALEQMGQHSVQAKVQNLVPLSLRVEASHPS